MCNNRCNCRCENCCGCRISDAFDASVLCPAGARYPQGFQGPTGPTGATGATGPAGGVPVVSVKGTVTGEPGSSAAVVESYSASGVDLLFTVPAGVTGATGAQGNKGDKGDKGDSGIGGSVFNFTVGLGPDYLVDNAGEPSTLVLSGFATSESVQIELDAGEWQNGVFDLPKYKRKYPSVLIMPRDATVKRLYALFLPLQGVTFIEDNLARMFVCLAVTDANDFNFRILKDTIAYSEPYEGDIEYDAFDTRRATRLDLNVSLAAGTTVAIVTGMVSEGPNNENHYQLFAVNGSFYIE